LLTSPELREFLERQKIRVVSYRDLKVSVEVGSAV
jgi:hypothetical protein